MTLKKTTKKTTTAQPKKRAKISKRAIQQRIRTAMIADEKKASWHGRSVATKIHILSPDGTLRYNRLWREPNANIARFESGGGFVDLADMKQMGCTIGEGWPS